MLYVVETAALAVLTFPLIADISKAAVLYGLYRRGVLLAVCFFSTLGPWVIKTQRMSSHFETRP